jgi:hypothetical protein
MSAEFQLTGHALRLGYDFESVLGFIPLMLNELNPMPAREQLNAGYVHGGGWSPLEGWTLREDNSIKYPGDPALKPLVVGKLRDETICVYELAWVAIIQPDRSFEVARMD